MHNPSPTDRTAHKLLCQRLKRSSPKLHAGLLHHLPK